MQDEIHRRESGCAVDQFDSVDQPVAEMVPLIRGEILGLCRRIVLGRQVKTSGASSRVDDGVSACVEVAP